MIRGSQLIGRSVVDIDAAERLGKIKEVIVRSDGERVAGFVVVKGESILGSGGTRRSIAAAALNAIGPDAVTVKGSAIMEQVGELDSLPRMSDVIGHKMVTRSGKLLGAIVDVLIDGDDGTILGFAIGEDVKSKLEGLFSPGKSHAACYVRADAELQVGKDLIVVPDDAAMEGELTSPGEEKSATASESQKVSARRWDEPAPESGKRSVWSRRVKADPASDRTGRAKQFPVNLGTRLTREQQEAPEQPVPEPDTPTGNVPPVGSV